MSFLNKILSTRSLGKKIEKETRDKEEPKAEKEVEKTLQVRGGTFVGGVLREAHITEKAALRAGTYVFKVSSKTNKTEVKRAIESRFEVKVEKVNVLNTFGKERRRGRQIGWKPGFKKAMVTLKEGQTIEAQ